jgi:hypothetical protein
VESSQVGADSGSGSDTWAEPLADQGSDDDRQPSYRGRLLHAAGSLLRIHLDVAQQEASRDQQRLLRGVVCLTIGGSILLLTLVLLQFVAVGLLSRVGLSLLAALGIVTGVDLICGLLLVVVGRRALKEPVLPQTRAVLARTLAALRSP